MRFSWACVALLLMVAAARAADTPAAMPIRQLSGKHIALWTDLPASSEVDALPAVFDAAFEQWCQYFDVDPAAHADWKRRVYLMAARERFAAAGHVPAELPDFLSGYTQGDRIWLKEQTSDYYRRHLLLHEGTHAFMGSLTTGMGPTWASETLAELLATHLGDGKNVRLDVLPPDRQSVPQWGRIEYVQRDVAVGRALSLVQIMSYGKNGFLKSEPYGWCWAAGAFFEHQPKYQKQFRALARDAGKPRFNEQFRAVFADDWSDIAAQWPIYLANLDYGYDFERMHVDFAEGKPLGNAQAKVSIRADRGWQSSGVRLEAGKNYRLSASGRYQIAQKPRVWWCEPGGVTIHYYRGQPLGILQAAIHSDANPAAPAGLLNPVTVGLSSTLTPPTDGTLYLRINDAAGNLADNAGTLDLTVARN